MNQDRISMAQALILAITVAVITALVVVTFMPRNSSVAASPTGTTFSSAKVAMINASFLTSTSTSLLNGDASSRYIKNIELACTGVGTSQTAFTGGGLTSSGWKLSAATSTSAASSAYLNANPNLVVASMVLSTSSPWLTIASSTIAVGGFSSTTEWLSGTYLDIFTNATNTAACTVGVSYIAS